MTDQADLLWVDALEGAALEREVLRLLGDSAPVVIDAETQAASLDGEKFIDQYADITACLEKGTRDLWGVNVVLPCRVAWACGWLWAQGRTRLEATMRAFVKTRHWVRQAPRI